MSIIHKDRFGLKIPYNGRCMYALQQMRGVTLDVITQTWWIPVDKIYETADIIDTYSYRLFMEMRGKEEASAAVGIFKTVINFILLIAGNMLTKKINGYNMFSID